MDEERRKSLIELERAAKEACGKTIRFKRHGRTEEQARVCEAKVIGNFMILLITPSVNIVYIRGNYFSASGVTEEGVGSLDEPIDYVVIV